MTEKKKQILRPGMRWPTVELSIPDLPLKDGGAGEFEFDGTITINGEKRNVKMTLKGKCHNTYHQTLDYNEEIILTRE